MNARKLFTILFGMMAGNVIAERFILRASDDDPTGFITVRDGIGLDEVARAATGVAVIMIIDRFVPRF